MTDFRRSKTSNLRWTKTGKLELNPLRMTALARSVFENERSRSILKYQASWERNLAGRSSQKRELGRNHQSAPRRAR